MRCVPSAINSYNVAPALVDEHPRGQCYNQKISEAVGRAGDQAVFFDFDKYYIDSLARVCEAGSAEPFGSRAGLCFYEYNTDDTVEPDTPDGKSALTRSGEPCAERHF